MVTDIDIWRSANLLLRRHGKDAAIVAAQRADECMSKGDVEGLRMWKRIAEAMLELLKEKPEAGERLNQTRVLVLLNLIHVKAPPALWDNLTEWKRMTSAESLALRRTCERGVLARSVGEEFGRLAGTVEEAVIRREALRKKGPDPQKADSRKVVKKEWPARMTR